MKPRESDHSRARCLTAGLLMLLASHALAVDIAGKPLIIPSPVAPNVVLTVEEHGYMRRGVPPYSPDISVDNPATPEVRAKRYHYSSHYNPLYYNPAIEYRVPSGYSTSFAAAWNNGYDDKSAKVDLGKKYRPTYSYDPNTDTNTYGRHPWIDVGASAPFRSIRVDAQAYYYRFNPGTGCDPVWDREEESCYSLVWVDGQERQNFANWYSFYRTRYLAAITALHLAMPKLEGKIRLAWQGTKVRPPWQVTGTTSGNYCMDLTGFNCRDRVGKHYDNGLKPFKDDHKNQFYQWLSRLGSGVTGDHVSMRAAMKRTGDYLSVEQRYCDDPTMPAGSGTNPPRSCRDNVHIMISDGEHRDFGNVGWLPAGGDVDSTAFALGESDFAIAYTPRVPYMDYPLVPKPDEKNAYTLADLAFYYWARDLAPGLENGILPYMPDQTGATEAEKAWKPRNNPATWQHIVNYAVISGMSFVLGDDWKTNTYDGAQAQGLKNWPYLITTSEVIYANSPRIYDYWHAALNSRGQFYGVDEVDKLVQALEDITNRIEKRLAASAAIAANSTRLDTGTVLYQARFTAVDWTGELFASKLTPGGAVGETLWTASIPPAGSRNLVTHDGAEAKSFDSPVLLPDDWNKQVGDADATKAEVLAWLRGDQSLEQSFDADGVLIGGKYRRREALLGDIVNSDPVYVGHQDYGYAALPEGGGDAYKNFVTANKNRVKMLYVGANDGMLHGFIAGAGTGAGHACGGIDTEKRGQELFAYIPNSARKMLPTLANPDYGRPGGIPHRYYVDGSPSVGDAHVGGTWRTILLGTTGAGGRTIFALDVTNPCEFGHGKVLWERDQSWDPDLGYTLAKPIIARLNNDKWAAVFGNGYNSDAGKAVLFVVDLETGALIRKFDLGGMDNGLSAPSLYDADNNGTTDYVYAGDMQGRLWKFDLTAFSPGSWSVAFGEKPLFTAVGPDGKPQPITAAPELGTPPAGASGIMVYFGTGRFFATGDEVDLQVQSLYGLHDSGSAIASRSQLVAQSITAEVVSAGKTVRKTSTNAVSYPTDRGWYLDLNFGGAKGERVISTPRRLFGRVFFTSMAPSSDPCKFGGTSWLMELEPGSGAMPETSVIEMAGEVVAGIMSTVGIVKSFDFLSGEGAVAIGLGSTGATGAIRLNPPGTSRRTGRISWREIID